MYLYGAKQGSEPFWDVSQGEEEEGDNKDMLW